MGWWDRREGGREERRWDGGTGEREEERRWDGGTGGREEERRWNVGQEGGKKRDRGRREELRMQEGEE